MVVLVFLNFVFCNFTYAKIKSKYNSVILKGCRDTVVMDTRSL